MENSISIELAPNVVSQIGPFQITSAHMGMFLISILIIIFAIFVRMGAGVKPSKLQVGFEALVSFMMDKMVIAFGDVKTAKKFFPLIFTIFLLLLFANQFALLPLVESVITSDGGNLFSTPAAHYSLPIAYTIFILMLAHVLALLIHPIRHIGNFIKIHAFFKIRKMKDIPMAFLEFFLGLLDIVGELAKLASLSTRLFGNMFAGGVIIIIITGITAYTQFIAPLPFLVLGILAGVVQAFVFAMLSAIYVSSTVKAVQQQNT